MISHIPILPLLIPLITGFILLLFKDFGLKFQRILSVGSIIVLLIVSIIALNEAIDKQHITYILGNWEAPFGIVLVLDKLSITMVLLTTILSLFALAYAISENIDSKGANFQVLFQLQLFGLNGAFLTGDLFNLFVFFEILLLASYSLLLHFSNKEKTKAGLHYVIINLVGSTLFLFAVGALYGILGTLNIADLALQISTLDKDNLNIIASAGLLLLVVFGLKAAMFPLYLWLPKAYSKTSAPVAALFAIMTKVGIYAIIRVHGTLFGESAGELAYYHTPWVLVIGIITLIMATFGIMSSKEIKNTVAYLVLASVSVLLISVGINTKDALSGTIYYLIHSTLISGGLFLLADIIVNSRQSDILTQKTPKLPNAKVIGILFFGYAIAIAGLPPLSGFFGKIMILYASLENPMYPIIIGTVLLSSLFIIVSLAKAGTTIFFDTVATDEPLKNNTAKHSIKIVAILLLIAPLLVIFANPITSFCNSIASDILNTNGYINAVLNKQIIGG